MVSLCVFLFACVCGHSCSWWRITAVGITSAVVGWKMYRNRKYVTHSPLRERVVFACCSPCSLVVLSLVLRDLGEWKNAAGQALHEFVTEHLVNPSKYVGPSHAS